MTAELLYRSDRSGVLWGLVVLVLLPVPVTAWLLTLPSDTQLLEDFGSLPAVMIWKVALLLLSSLLFWPMLWLSGRYVTQVQRAGEGRISVEVWSLLGPRRREWASAFTDSEFHRGYLSLPYTPLVDAPWVGYRTPEGKKLMVDEQGDFPQGRDTLQAAMLHKPS